MQIDRVELRNFRQHEHTEIRFGPGLTGIIGPNGAGKSTILEGIAWAMYGMPAARGSRETIKRRGAGARARVEVALEFTLGAHRFRVERSLTTAALYQDGGTEAIANSIATVTERVTRLLGMSREEFFHTYFTGQKELAAMAAMAPTERQQFLSRVLGYERLKAAQDALRERRTALRAQLEGLKAGLADVTAVAVELASARDRAAAATTAVEAAERALARRTATRAEVQPRYERLAADRDRHAAIVAERRLSEERAAAAEAQVVRLTAELAAATGASARLAELAPALAAHAPLRTERHALDAAAAAASAREQQRGQLAAARARVADLEVRLAALPSEEQLAAATAELERARRVVAEAAEQLSVARTGWTRDQQEAETRLRTLRDQYKDLKEQHDRLAALGADGACPTCARPLGTEFDSVLGVLHRQLDDVLADGTYYSRRVEQLKKPRPEVAAAEEARQAADRGLEQATAAHAALAQRVRERATLQRPLAEGRDRVAALEAALGGAAAEYDATRHQEVLAELARLEPLVLEAERHRVLAARAPAITAELAAAREAREQALVRQRALAEEDAALGFSEVGFRAVAGEAQEADRAVQEGTVALERARGEAQAATEAVRVAERRRAEAEAREREVATVQRDLLTHGELDRAYTDLRQQLNEQLRPELGEIASGFLRDLTSGRYNDLELDESYLPMLVDDGEPKPVISGGEEDVANLAIRLAISQMIAERAGQPLSLLVLDEVFGSLDEDRRAAVVDLLRSLADRFPQVILITHIDAVREGFDRVLRVRFDQGARTASVADEPIGALPGGDDVAA